MSESYHMVETSRQDRVHTYKLMPSGIGGSTTANSVSTEYGQDSSAVFDDGGINTQIQHRQIEIEGRNYEIVQWGDDNLLPYHVLDTLGQNMVATQCQAFNTLCCYGQGLRFVDRKEKKDVDDADINAFCLANSLQEVFLEQATDMKYWFWTVTVFVLSRDGKRIASVRHREAMHCRLEYAPSTDSGTIEHVFYGDWRPGGEDTKHIEVIPLLNYYDPLGDLMVRMGRKPDPATGMPLKKPAKERKFAVISRMATPGYQVYPKPYYMSAMRDAWLDIYRLIGLGKRYMIKNTSAPRIQIEIHEDYWDSVCDNANVTDEAARKKLKEEEKQRIIEFVTGVENAGKAMVSGYYVDPNGKENRMVRFYSINDASKKEGGDWSDDMSEASNAICFALGVHPNLVGATPGKSQMNNSGSDKRELFTLKQATEKACHDVMCKPYHVILHYNGWQEKVTVDVPMIQLTTLDQNKDAQAVTTNNSDDNANNNQ